MGRKSKLTDKQWDEIRQRHIDGESIRSLADKFKVAESSVREKISGDTKRIKAVANQILETEVAIRSLPISAQISAHNLADQLRSISGHLAGAANFGAATAHRLAGIANGRVAQIDDAKPLDDAGVKELKGISVLTQMANDASVIGVNLLRANKESIDAMNNGDAPEDMHWTVNLVPANAG
jgi:uncharacterized protein (DUF2342 family)